MRTVDIKLLAGRLGDHVRLAPSGETIPVTDDGRGSRSSARRGAVVPPSPPPVARLEEILEELDADRSDR